MQLYEIQFLVLKNQQGRGDNTVNFGEKVKELRTKKGLSQAELAKLLGVTIRTVCGWETEGRYPRKQELYGRIAETLGCQKAFLLDDDDSFYAEVTEKYGDRGRRQAQAILEQASALFAGGELSEQDQLAFIHEIQGLYLDSKERAKRFTPKKYLRTEPAADETI